jgi:heme/copper-type cytochrome/quinol oxidase subunit 2
MKLLIKLAIVLGGYLLAVGAAFAAVALNEARLSALPEPASDGMAAFGDLVLAVLVFGAVSVLPTGAAIYFLVTGRRNAGTRPVGSAG